LCSLCASAEFWIVSKVLNVTYNTIVETTYEFLSDHIGIMIVVQKRLKIVRLEIKYRPTLLLDTLTMKQLTTSLPDK